MRKKITKYSLGGFLFAVFNEVYYAPLWNYSEALSPFLFDDIPLVSFVGWPVISCLILLLSDWLHKKINLNLIIQDVLLFTIIVAPAEYILSRAGLWEYNYWLHENICGMVIGYALTSVIISSVCRRL